MSDFTLDARITADASELEREAQNAEQAVEEIASTSESAAQRVAGAFSNAFSSFGGSIQNGLSSAGQTLSNIGGKFEAAGKQMTASGKAMSIGITAPLTALYKASDSAFKEVDAGMDVVVQKTGATGEALEGLQDVMKNVATSIPTDFATAGEAVGEVNTRFGVTGDELEKLSEKFVKFANLNGTQVSSSVDRAQQIISAFGLSVDDAGALLDTFNKVGQDTCVNLDVLMSSMVTNSAAFKDMGFSAADTAKFLGELEVSGADSSQVLAGLKKSLQNAAKEGKPMSAALEDVQKSIKNAKSDTEATRIAMELFGSKAGASIAKAVREGKLSFDELGASLTDAQGNIDTTFENTQDASDKMATAMNSVKLSIAGVSEQVKDKLAPYLETAAGAIQKVSDWFNNLSPGMQDMIIKIALIAAAIGPLLLVLGSISSAIGGLIGANGLGGLLTLLGGLSTPVLAVIAIFTLLIGVFTTLWTTNEEFRNKVIEIWTEIQTIFATAFAAISELLTSHGVTVENIKAAWLAFCDFVAPFIISAFELIKVGIQVAMDVIVGIISFALDFVQGLFKYFHGWLTGDNEEMWEGVKQIFHGALEFLKGLFKAACDFLGIDAEKLKETIKEKFTALKDGAIEKFTALKEKAVEKFEALKEKAGEIFDNCKQAVSDKVDDIRQTVEDGFNAAVEFITSLPGEAFNWGADIIDGIVDGIWSAFGSLTSVLSDIAGTIWDYLHFSEPDVGPLRDFHTWMPDMMKGLAQGMKRNLPVLEAGVSLVADSMAGVIPGTGNAGGYGGGDDNSVHSFGSVYVTVNGAPGQNEEALADAVADRIMSMIVAEGV